MNQVVATGLAEKAVDLKEIGLQLGFTIGKYFFQTEHLHYGYWTEGLAVNVPNLHQAQENFINYLMARLPAGTRTILDVGCGAGKNAERLLNAGYQVDCVSPNTYLTEQARLLLGQRSHIYECGFEHLQTDKTYDLVMFSESFQYVPLEPALDNVRKVLKDGGHLLICDFFKKDVEGKSPISGGHRLTTFYETMRRYPFVPLQDEDITEKMAPTLDIMNEILTKAIHPIWLSVGHYMKHKYPWMAKGFNWKFKKKLEKMDRKYFHNGTTGKNFATFKSYRFLLYQKR